MKMRISLGSRPRNQTIEELMSNGTAVIGSPQTVRERIERIRDQTGLNIMIALLQFGEVGINLPQDR
jgi:alkanesulfonate monooxygenase SsuD/methylene tetrahydromethanopterin reductase-like flavin-dependent oxidoreductase (luciferase family)